MAARVKKMRDSINQMQRAAEKIASKWNIPALEVFAILEEYGLEAWIDVITARTELENTRAQLNFLKPRVDLLEPLAAAAEHYLRQANPETEANLRQVLEQYRAAKRKMAN